MLNPNQCNYISVSGSTIIDPTQFNDLYLQGSLLESMLLSLTLFSLKGSIIEPALLSLTVVLHFYKVLYYWYLG